MWERLIEALEVLVIGMGAIFASLTFFYLLIVVLKKADTIMAKNDQKKAQAKSDADDLIVAEDNIVTTDEITPELIAVISAAAYSIVRKPVRIKTISFLGNKDDTAWSQMGKMDVISSHNVQRH